VLAATKGCPTYEVSSIPKFRKESHPERAKGQKKINLFIFSEEVLDEKAKP
jgi:hypothetical protein